MGEYPSAAEVKRAITAAGMPVTFVREQPQGAYTFSFGDKEFSVNVQHYSDEQRIPGLVNWARQWWEASPLAIRVQHRPRPCLSAGTHGYRGRRR